MESNVLNKKKSKKDVERVVFILFCITVPIIQWLLFYVFTNVSSVFLAFQDSAGHFSLENFKRFFVEMGQETSTLRIAFKNTFITFGLLLVSYPFKVLVSYFIYKRVPGYSVFRILFFLPGILVSICTAMAFKQMVGTDGFIAQWVQNFLGLDQVPELLADSRFANTVIILEMLWLGFPGDLIIWGGTFARIPEEVMESARIDGVTWWSEFTKITVPLVWPTVALQMVLMFAGIFGASGNVFLLTRGGHGTMTLSAWLYITLLDSSGSQYTSGVYNYLSAVGILISVVAITISLSVRKFTDKVFDDVEF